MKWKLAALGLAAFSVAAQQQDNGPHIDQDIHLTSSGLGTSCTIADGISFLLNDDKPVCSKTVGEWPGMGLTYPQNAPTDKCIFVPSTIPSNVDVSRPAFARITYEQLTGPTNVNAPQGCAARPAACTVLTIQPFYLIEGESLFEPQPGGIVVSDFLGNQHKPLRSKFTATFRGITNAGNPTRAAELMSQYIEPRRPIVWKICRPVSRPSAGGATSNVTFTIRLYLLNISWPLNQ